MDHLAPITLALTENKALTWAPLHINGIRFSEGVDHESVFLPVLQIVLMTQ